MNHKFGKLRLCFAAALLALGVVAVAAPNASAIVRAKSATPYSVPLVIAHTQCVAPNSTHNPANLAGGSCVPETKNSPYLTAGEPPLAGAANFQGRLHFVVCITAGACSAGGGSGSTDVLFPPGAPGKNFLADVRCEAAAPWVGVLCPTGNAAGGPDYGSGVPPATSSLLWATAGIRITDRNNGAPGYTSEGTVEDLDFPVPVICLATADTAIGGACSPLFASANGACGGCVASGKLSNIEIAPWTATRDNGLVVQDPGPDGNATTVAGNNDFATPGVFIP
jgi:hypothetical protein